MTEYLVRGASGSQFSIHPTETAAQRVADSHAGFTVEPYVPVLSIKYDWLHPLS